MNRVIQFYRLLNILSVDISMGAVINALFFAHIFNVQIRLYGLMSLGLTVWIIYTLDHLLDAKNTKHNAATTRHRFHQQHFKTLFSIVIGAVFIEVALLFFIRQQVILAGLFLSLLIVVYFFVQRYLGFIKEFFGALLYCGGVMLLPLSLMGTSLSSLLILVMIQFCLTAFINLLLFSWFDRKYDEQDSHQSFTTVLGTHTTFITIVVLLIMNVALTFIQMGASTYRSAGSIIFFMNMILVLIICTKKHFALNDRYRLLGDAIFLLPVIYFL